MLIKSIKIKNMRSYIDEKIEFPAGSVLLSGDVGSGKSTILLAMDFALFGTRRGELDSSALLRHGADEGHVEMEFESEGKNVKIKRSLKRKKTISQDSGEIIIDGMKKNLSPSELKAKVFELLGYPQDIIKKNKPIFRFTVYTPQEQMKNILLYPQERLEILRKIFGVDRYGTIKNNSKALVTEIRSMKREIESYIRDLDEKTAKKQELESDKIRIIDELGKEKENLIRKDDELRAKKAELDESRQSAEEMRKIKQELIEKESEKSSKEKRLTSIQNDISEFHLNNN